MPSEIAQELITILGYELDGEGKVKRYNEGLNNTGKNANKLSKTLKGLAGAAVVGTAFKVGKDSFLEFAKLERQLNRIGITGEASVQETKAALETIQGLTIDFGFSSVAEASEALDVLTSSGMNLQSSLEFLPSVLATAQASGASTADIANTAQKASSALGITAAEMQMAFDIMVAGGKAGQFELKDMAQFIPSLSNQFALLGNSGLDGLKELIVLLQTVREDTGSSSAAATQLGDIFGKIRSDETVNKFKKFGVNLDAELDAATASGEGLVKAFIRISKEALNGDLDKIGKLFADKEMRLGMASLITSADSVSKFFNVVDNADVDGSVFRDLQRVLSDTQADIDELSANWDILMANLAQGISVVAVPAIESVNEAFDDRRSLSALLEEQKAIDKKNGVETSFLDGVLGRGSAQSRLAERILDTQGIEGLRNSPLNKADKNEILIDRGFSFAEAKSITDSSDDSFNADFDKDSINSRVGAKVTDDSSKSLAGSEVQVKQPQVLDFQPKINSNINHDNPAQLPSIDLSRINDKLQILNGSDASQKLSNQTNINNSGNVGDTNINIEQNVQGAVNAPSALADASAEAVAGAISSRSQIQADPVTP